MTTPLTARPFGRLLVLTALLLSACGGNSDTSIVDATTPDIAPETANAETPDAETPDAGAEPESAPGALLAAFSNLGQASGYRVVTSQGQTMTLPAFGVDARSSIDPSRPAATLEVAPNGDSHALIDLGPLLVGLAGGDPTIEQALDTVHAEVWTSETRLVIDSTGYQAIADLNPAVDLGPFAPGVGEVDLLRATDVAGPDLVQALVGVGVANPIQLATTLPASLANVEQDPADPSVYSATATYSNVVEALGGDLDVVAGGLAAGIAQAIGSPVGEVADFYVSYFESVEADLEFVIGDDGALRTLSMSIDLSSIYSEMLTPGTGIDFDATATELANLEEMFADAVLTTTSLSTFELDDSIVVESPTGDLEDRTDSVLEFFAGLAVS